MRNALIALILPATLATGGFMTASAQEAEAPPAGEAATEAVDEGDAAEEAVPAPALQPVAVSEDLIPGTWSAAANSVTYTSNDGENIMTFSCNRSDGGNVMALRMPSPTQGPVEQLAVFGGAGAGVIVPEDQGDGTLIGGRFDPWGSIGTMLATGLGEVRVVADDSSVTVANAEIVEALVESCQPPLPTVAERLAAIIAEREAAAYKPPADES